MRRPHARVRRASGTATTGARTAWRMAAPHPTALQPSPGADRLAVLTRRPAVLRARLAAADINAGLYTPQPGSSAVGVTLPDVPGPLLLDTVGMPLAELAALLVARLPHAHGGTDARPVIVVLVGLDDWAAQRLALLAPQVQLLIGEDQPLQLLRPWLPHLTALRRGSSAAAVPRIGLAALDVPHLPAAFLSVFAALAHARTIDQVAAACYRSRKTVQRDLAAARQALGMPPGAQQRFRPAALAAAFAVALGRDPAPE